MNKKLIFPDSLADFPDWEKYEIERHYNPSCGKIFVERCGIELTPEELFARRHAGEPLEYILGHCHVDDDYIKTDRRSLIPRPETEELIEIFCRRASRLELAPVVDCGTGSGVIAGALSQRIKQPVIATDRDRQALELARENKRLNGWSVNYINCDRLSAVKGPLAGVVANLPYVFRVDDLVESVKKFEPRQALIPTENPIRFFVDFLTEAEQLLLSGGELWLEGSRELFQALKKTDVIPGNWSAVDCLEDGYGKERFIGLRK